MTILRSRRPAASPRHAGAYFASRFTVHSPPMTDALARLLFVELPRRSNGKEMVETHLGRSGTVILIAILIAE